MNFRGSSSIEQQLFELSRRGDIKELTKLLRDNKKLNINTANSLGSTPLLEASSKGHVEVVQFLLERGAHVDATRNSGWSALMVACGEGYLPVVHVLLEAGADVHFCADDVGTPLLLACLRGHANIVRLLLERGAHVHEDRTQNGCTPLILAAKGGHNEVCTTLVEWGADVNAQDSTLGRTAVAWASVDNHIRVVQYLIDAGADLSLVDHNFDSAEDLARDHGHHEVADLISSHFNPLRNAAEQGDLKGVQRILKDKARLNIDSADAHGTTALIHACRHGHVKIAKVLMEAGAEVNMADETGATALVEASKSGQEDMVHLLLEYGAHVNAIDQDGYTSLMAASAGGFINIVYALIQEAADVNAATFDHAVTALMLASEHGHADIVSLLLENHADISALNHQGETALDIAHNGQMDTVVDILSKAQNPLVYACRTRDLQQVREILAQDPNLDLEMSAKDGNTALIVACGEGDADIVQELLLRNADVNAANSSGATALMEACWNGHVEIVQLLIEKGCNINAIDDEGGTALMLASKNGHYDSAKLLIEHGANVNAVKFDDGWTSLIFASENGYAEIVHVLIDEGADVNAADHEGWTPLMEACIEGHLDIAITLIEYGANINACTSDGWTSLMLSSLRGHFDTVVTLVEHGAEINAGDNDHVNSLMWASKNGHLDIVKKLVELGADIHMTNDLGESPIDFATKAKKNDVVDFLSSLADTHGSSAQNGNYKMPPDGRKISSKIDDKMYILLDILEGRIYMYKSLYDPYPLQYLKDCSDNFRSSFGKGVYRSAFNSVDKTNPKLKHYVKRSTSIKLSDDSLNLREDISALVQSRHPNILRILGYAVNEKFHNEAYLVMESIPKHGSLNEFLAKEDKRAILSAIHRCRIMCEIIKAISFLHNGGVVDGTSDYKFLHRDINSSCICLTADLTAKLVIDYDKVLVELSDEDDTLGPSDGTIVGTTGYTCPWYSRGNRKYQAECDLFSFGVVLLEMITGSLQAGQKCERSFGEDLVDRYFFSNDSSLLVKDADPTAGGEWSEVILSLAKVALSCVDFDPFKRPNALNLSEKLSRLFVNIC